MRDFTELDYLRLIDENVFLRHKIDVLTKRLKQYESPDEYLKELGEKILNDSQINQ